MAASGQVIEQFAEVSGFLPSTLDRMLRPLRSAGLVPFGEKGRGQRQGHYEPEHLANVLLAFAAPQPSECAEVAEAMRNWRYGWTASNGPAPQVPLTPGDTLGEVLAEIISREAKRILARLEKRSDLDPPYLPYSVLFAPGTEAAQLHWFMENKQAINEYYVGRALEGRKSLSPATMNSNVVSRQTLLSHWMIRVAAELAADTMARRSNRPALLSLLQAS